MNYLSTSMRELTDKLNSIAEKLENETDEDEIMTLRFQAGVAMEIMKKLVMGKSIAKYDIQNNESYVEFDDGRKKKIDSVKLSPIKGD